MNSVTLFEKIIHLGADGEPAFAATLTSRAFSIQKLSHKDDFGKCRSRREYSLINGEKFFTQKVKFLLQGSTDSHKQQPQRKIIHQRNADFPNMYTKYFKMTPFIMTLLSYHF